jgi:hypothetical protein
LRTVQRFGPSPWRNRSRKPSTSRFDTLKSGKVKNSFLIGIEGRSSTQAPVEQSQNIAYPSLTYYFRFQNRAIQRDAPLAFRNFSASVAKIVG